MGARGWFIVVLLALGAGAGWFLLGRFEGDAPRVEAPETLLLGGTPAPLQLVVRDAGSGLRSVAVVLTHPGGEQALASESLPGGLLAGGAVPDEPLVLELELSAEGLPSGADSAVLTVLARDWSLRGAFTGNETRVDVPVTIDRRPPRISVVTGLTYVRRGGSGVVLYSVDEPTARDGVEVGDHFFPGHPLGSGRVAVYAVPTWAPENPSLRVLAEDAAGNVGRARWPVVVNERSLPHDDVRLPASFLEAVVVPLAESEGLDAADPAEAFKVINTAVRERNEARIRQELSDSAPRALFEGPFEQLRNSKVTSRFAEKRRYFVDGEPLSEAIHYGYDLAATRAGPITAAAAGRVAFAGELGIYGNCVLIDHGLGVGSLYGHLSRLDVQPGDEVGKGDPLGLSGATGLAGGDHLHFAILVGGVYVDPLEWWDPSWVRNNVEMRLARSGP